MSNDLEEIFEDANSVIIREKSLQEWASFVPKEVRKYMEQNLLNLGFGNSVVADRVVAIVSPVSSPMKRLKDEARKDRRLVDATHGRRTRSIIILDSNHIILSAVQVETISQRYNSVRESQ